MKDYNEFENKYQIIKPIPTLFSSQYIGINIKTNLKVFIKLYYNKKEIQNIIKEKNEFMIENYDIFYDFEDKVYYVVNEYMSNGRVFDHLMKNENSSDSDGNFVLDNNFYPAFDEKFISK